MTKNFTFKSLKTTIPKFKIGSNGFKNWVYWNSCVLKKRKSAMITMVSNGQKKNKF
jgi:hypothetical protein